MSSKKSGFASRSTSVVLVILAAVLALLVVALVLVILIVALLIVLILLILIVLAVILVLLILIVQRHVTLSFHSGLPLLFHIFRFLYSTCALPLVFHFLLPRHGSRLKKERLTGILSADEEKGAIRMANCTACSNTHECSCPNTACSNHGKCCDCVANHKKRGSLPLCMRPAAEGK